LKYIEGKILVQWLKHWLSKHKVQLPSKAIGDVMLPKHFWYHVQKPYNKRRSLKPCLEGYWMPWWPPHYSQNI